jgi:hypothetical protein
MVGPLIDYAQLKDALKAALSEILEERPDLLRELIAEVLEDFALTRAIQAGDAGERVTRDEVFHALDALK